MDLRGQHIPNWHKSHPLDRVPWHASVRSFLESNLSLVNILLTGASGLVGSAFARLAAQQGHRVIGIVGSFSSPVPGVADHVTVDLANEAQTRAYLQSVRVDAIVNCAAVAVPTACDVDPIRSEALNVTLPRLLAETALQLGARLVHLSSEQVYDGTRTTPYSSDDAPNPINLYGRQKLRSEQAVRAISPAMSVVIRPPLLLGNSLSGSRSTHEALFATWSAGKTPKLFIDEFRQTCTADHLAAVILAVGGRTDIAGIFNWAGAELVSRYDLARRLRDHFGLVESAAPIAAVSRTEDPAATRSRPGCLALDTTPLSRAVHMPPQTFAQQLAELAVPPPFRDWHARHRVGR